MDLLLAAAASPADFVAARTQMAFTLACHIILASIGIGLPGLTLLAEWRGHRSGDAAYVRLARQWAKATAVLFAVGAVSGTVLSFEMGVLWPEFMGRFGDVIGLPFAIEGIAFFLEAIFIGVYLYGWDRLPPRQHLLTGIPIVVGGLASAFFVVTVNAWMNQPRGFRLADGEVVDVRPLAAMFNPATPHEAVHLLLANLMVCGFLVASVYAVALLRGRRDRYHRLGFLLPFGLGAAAAPLQVIVGDWAARFVSSHQPVKFAAMEGVLETQAGTPMHLGGLVYGGEVRHALAIPDGLSLLLRFEPDAVIRGLDTVPANAQPPVNVVHLSFQLMVAAGTALLGLAGWFALSWWRRGSPPTSRWFLRAAIPAGFLACVAMLAGWTTTEVGRQPWIVYGVMRTEEAVNPNPGLVAGLYVVLAVYAALAAMTVWILRRIAGAKPAAARTTGDRRPPGEAGTPEEVHRDAR